MYICPLRWKGRGLKCLGRRESNLVQVAGGFAATYSTRCNEIQPNFLLGNRINPGEHTTRECPIHDRAYCLRTLATHYQLDPRAPLAAAPSLLLSARPCASLYTPFRDSNINILLRSHAKHHWAQKPSNMTFPIRLEREMIFENRDRDEKLFSFDCKHYLFLNYTKNSEFLN